MQPENIFDSCPPQCPGCPVAHRDPQKSARLKTQWVKRILSPWANRIHPIRAPAGADRFHYRDKVCLCAQWSEPAWQLGLRAAQSVVPAAQCRVHTHRVNRGAQILARRMPPENRFPLKYYLQSGAQVSLVLKSARMPETDWLDKRTRQDLSDAGVEGLWLHLFPSAGRRVTAKNAWHLVTGRPRSVDSRGFVYGPTSFQQLIPELGDEALELAESFLEPAAGDRVLDLYCGAGGSLARWSARGAAACGVDISGENTECAGRNAPDATILRGSCAHRIPQLRQWMAPAGLFRRKIYANPPRTGMEEAVRRWIAGPQAPCRMAYLSCSAGTLRRDLEFFCNRGFTVTAIYPYDFFPNTRHVEILALLKGA